MRNTEITNEQLKKLNSFKKKINMIDRAVEVLAELEDLQDEGLSDYMSEESLKEVFPSIIKYSKESFSDALVRLKTRSSEYFKAITG